MTALFSYVGPPEIRDRVKGDPQGLPIKTIENLRTWANSDAAKSESGWATYVISADHTLLVAPRRTEHVACAGGGPVRCAGELRTDDEGTIVEISNNSTGFCPSEEVWPVARDVLDQIGIERPDEFTFVATFRRCDSCGQRNLVKDGWFECSVCGEDLPREYNFYFPAGENSSNAEAG